jgi:hypothetical protein
MKYRLMVSYDYGVTYQCESESDSPLELEAKGRLLDEKFIRWVIEDDTGNDIGVWCAAHAGHARYLGYGDRISRYFIEDDMTQIKQASDHAHQSLEELKTYLELMKNHGWVGSLIWYAIQSARALTRFENAMKK